MPGQLGIHGPLGMPGNPTNPGNPTASAPLQDGLNTPNSNSTGPPPAGASGPPGGPVGPGGSAAGPVAGTGGPGAGPGGYYEDEMETKYVANPVNTYLPPAVYEPQPLPGYRPYEYYHNGPQAAGVSSSVSGPSSTFPLNSASVLLAPMPMGSASSSGPSSSSSFLGPKSAGNSGPDNSNNNNNNNMYMPLQQNYSGPGGGPGGQQSSSLPGFNYQQQYPYRQSSSFSGYPQNSIGAPPETGRNKCPVCHKVFKRPLSLQIHFYIHTGVTMFKCEWEGCGRMFNVKLNMKRHYRLHLKREEEKRMAEQ